MLHKPDAAYLTQTGRGYLQVGNDEVYEQFQSGWSGAVYDAEGGSSKNGAVLLDLQGREMVSGRRSKGEKKKKAMQKWMTEIVTVIADFCEKMQISDLSDCTREERRTLAKQVIGELNCKEERFPENASNLHIMEEIIHYLPQEADGPEEAADYLIEVFQENNKKLPEQKEITQLDAVVRYLGELAEKNHYINKQKLWMPELPKQLAITELRGYE